MRMLAHFAAMADYNRWANTRLYADVGNLPEENRHRDVGIYFKSLFKTLSHILNTDRAWTHILQGGTLETMRLPAVPLDFEGLRFARLEQDQVFIGWLSSIDEAWLDQPLAFTSKLGSFTGMTYDGTHGSTLTHVFNHQTHHRGQAHAALSILGVGEPQALDMLVKGFLQR